MLFPFFGHLGQILKAAEEDGVMLIDKAPRKGAEGLNIAFLHPKSTFGVLTELCENPAAEGSCCCKCDCE